METELNMIMMILPELSRFRDFEKAALIQPFDRKLPTQLILRLGFSPCHWLLKFSELRASKLRVERILLGPELLLKCLRGDLLLGTRVRGLPQF